MNSLFTTLNGLFLLYNSINDFYDTVDSSQGAAHYKSESFDLMTFRDSNVTTYVDDSREDKLSTEDCEMLVVAKNSELNVRTFFR